MSRALNPMFALLFVLLESACDGGAPTTDGGSPGDGGSLGDASREGRDGAAPTPDASMTRSDSGSLPPPPADWCTRDDTTLGRIASALAPRSFAEVPANASLDALDMGYSLLYWNDSGVWDPMRRQVHWVGGPGSCCADPPDYQRISWDIASDTWTIERTPFSSSGHAYDANALDPTTGAHYFALLGDPVTYRLLDGEWSMLPEIPFDPATTPGLGWLANLRGGEGGLVFSGGYGAIAWFDGASWHELDGALDEPWGSYNNFTEPNPRHGVVWVGGGDRAEQVHYRMLADGTLTRVRDAPFSLSVAAALHAYEPASGKYIVFRDEDNSFHEYDIMTDTWTALSDLTGVPDFGESRFQVPIPECNVILFFDHYWDERRVFLYRHL